MSLVYIAGSLRHTPKEWWQIYEKIGKVVSKNGLKPHIPHIDTGALVNQGPEDLHNPNLELSKRAEVYKTNFEMIKKSKLIIAEISYPSTGTGMEIGFALLMDKPVICLARENFDVTSMVLGPVHLGLINFIRYKDEKEALGKLDKILKNLAFK